MTLRWISLVPPAMDRARLPRKPPVHDGAVALAGDARPGRAAPGPPPARAARARRRAACARWPRGRADRRRAPAAWCARRAWRWRGRSATSPPSRSATSGVVEPPRALGQVEQRPRRPGPNDEPDAIDTRSLASVVRAHSQPSVGPADQAVVGHEHVVEEDLVEHRHAGELAQRPDVDARRRHVDHEAADALVAGRVGIGAGQADGPVGPIGHRRPHLLAGDRPAAVDPRRPAVVSEARSLPAPGSLNIWHQRDLAPQRRPDDPALLLLGACRGR